MTIDEAIYILSIHDFVPPTVSHLKAVEAKHLGIESLKRLKDIREYRFGITDKLLLGETEE
jgi:hypothetical protein